MRRRTALLVAGVASLVVLLAAGLTRASYPAPGGTRACADRTAVAALRSGSSGDPVRDACTRDSQRRAYTALASLMGLVLISGLLSRRDPLP